MRQMLANRDARLYLSGNIVSTFGDRVLWLAVAIWVRVLTGSNAAAGLTFFFLVVPQMIFAPLAGVLADRFRRRPLLIIANLIGAGVVMLLTLVHGAGQVWLIYLVMVLYGSLGTLISATGTALMVTVVPGEQLGEANGFVQTLTEGMRLVTPLIGAGLFTLVGGAVVAEIDAATFLIAPLLLALMRLREIKPVPQPGHWLKTTTAGFGHIYRTVVLRQVTVALLLTISVVGFMETAFFAIVTAGLHRPAAFVGVLISIQGIGAIAGGLSSPKVMQRIGEARLAGLGIAAVALAAAGMVWPAWLTGVLPMALVVASMVVAGIGIPWLMVGAMTLVQRRTPLPLQGCVDAALSVIFGGVQSASIGVGALLVGLLGFVAPILIIFVVCTIAALYLLTRQLAAGEEGLPTSEAPTAESGEDLVLSGPGS